MAGGYTMICAMPNTNPSVTSDETLRLVEDLYKQKSICDYGLFLGTWLNEFGIFK